ncbi:MAG: GIY-YIG nuclease family protein [Pseudomonadota bacterium]|nr:GIY-YIG nuclease family protein [Pseudomonadota bacterium]
MAVLRSEPGSYALLLRADSDAVVTAGGLGELAIKAGLYLYLGSARGPGGVAARVARHLRGGRSHWHLDYLRPVVQPLRVWVAYTPEKLECLWAKSLFALPGIEAPVRRFGSSDCRCIAHLGYYAADPWPNAAWEGTFPGTLPPGADWSCQPLG